MVKVCHTAGVRYGEKGQISCGLHPPLRIADRVCSNCISVASEKRKTTCLAFAVPHRKSPDTGSFNGLPNVPNIGRGRRRFACGDTHDNEVATAG